jgi:hypothetical protein
VGNKEEQNLLGNPIPDNGGNDDVGVNDHPHRLAR